MPAARRSCRARRRMWPRVRPATPARRCAPCCAKNPEPAGPKGTRWNPSRPEAAYAGVFTLHNGRMKMLRRLFNACLLHPQDVSPSRDDMEVIGVFNPGVALTESGVV